MQKDVCHKTAFRLRNDEEICHRTVAIVVCARVRGTHGESKNHQNYVIQFDASSMFLVVCCGAAWRIRCSLPFGTICFSYSHAVVMCVHFDDRMVSLDKNISYSQFLCAFFQFQVTLRYLLTTSDLICYSSDSRFSFGRRFHSFFIHLFVFIWIPVGGDCIFIWRCIVLNEHTVYKCNCHSPEFTIQLRIWLHRGPLPRKWKWKRDRANARKMEKNK